jgi:stage V sporulation protein SpoVS
MSEDAIDKSGNVEKNDENFIDEHDIKLDEQTIKEVAKEIVPNDKISLESLRVAADPQDITPEERKRNVKKLAGAISHSLRTNGEIDVRAFGNAAIGKSVKALAIAKDYIEDTHKLRLAYSPAFITTNIGEATLTGIKFCTFCFDGEEQPKMTEADCKSTLKVTADPKDINPEERRLRVRKLAGAISHAVEEHGKCAIRCFGNASIGKACKALAIARGFTATRGADLYSFNEFIITKMGDNERTGICFIAYSNNI